MAVQVEEQLLTVEEVATFLNVPISWVYERCRPSASDPLPHVKLGKYLRFFKSDLLLYLEKWRCGDSFQA